jgi:hypothetical protein
MGAVAHFMVAQGGLHGAPVVEKLWLRLGRRGHDGFAILPCCAHTLYSTRAVEGGPVQE